MHDSNHAYSTRNVPLHDEHAERQLIAAVLLDPSKLTLVNLRAADFNSPAHAHVWAEMQGIADEGLMLSEFLVIDRLKRLPAEWAAELGMSPAKLLVEIIAVDANAANIVEYADIVRQKAEQRRAEQASPAVLTVGSAGPEPKMAEKLVQLALELHRFG